jgi:hypothetical protein
LIAGRTQSGDDDYFRLSGHVLPECADVVNDDAVRLCIQESTQWSDGVFHQAGCGGVRLRKRFAATHLIAARIPHRHLADN